MKEKKEMNFNKSNYWYDDNKTDLGYVQFISNDNYTTEIIQKGGGGVHKHDCAPAAPSSPIPLQWQYIQ